MLFLLKHRVWIAKFNDTTISVMLSKEKTYSEQEPRCCYQCEELVGSIVGRVQPNTIGIYFLPLAKHTTSRSKKKTNWLNVRICPNEAISLPLFQQICTTKL